MTAPADSGDSVAGLNRHFARCLLALGKVGQDEAHEACRIAAAAWSGLRRTHPREAQRLNGVLHSLARYTHPVPSTKENTHVQDT